MVDHTMGGLLERCAVAYGPDTAVVFEDREITYAEQIARIRQCGRALLQLGLRAGDRVGLLMDDRPELLDAYYGVAWAGLVVVPLNAKLSIADHLYILRDSGARALIYDDAHAAAAEAVSSDIEFAIGVGHGAAGTSEFHRLLGRQPDHPGRPGTAADDLFGIYYTGGTTGQPKGAVHSHRTFVAALISEMLEMGLGARDRFAHVAPLTHAGGAFVLPVWLRGGTNLIMGGFDPERLVHSIASQRVTATMMVPTMLYVLLDHPALRRVDTASLQTVIYGASPIGQQRLLQGLERFGPVFSQLYGQTEAPNQLAVLHKDDHARAVASGALDVLSSCGHPVTIAEVRLVDDDDREVPAGEPGEIVARGPHVMLRYWDKPQETADAVRGGWLHTGDVARVDERGFLYIVDRKKDMVISGGFNVYPKEVETTLFAHPAVRDVCVIGVPDDKWGEAVKAVVVTDPDQQVSAQALIDWVKARKGSVLSPKTVDFVDAIPLTPLGKHDKAGLRAAYWGDLDRGVH